MYVPQKMENLNILNYLLMPNIQLAATGNRKGKFT